MAAYAAYAVYAVYAAAAAATVYSAVETSRVSSNNAKNAAQLNEYNAAVASNNAEAARRAASAKEDAFRHESGQFLAKQRAAAAESGFDSATGSTALLLDQSADSAELDALMIRHQGTLEAQGYSSSAVIERYRGATQDQAATQAIRSGYVNAASGLLSTAASYGRSGVKVA